ncbi:MAG: DUF523 domain-containing protein [Clostridia bacterium]|nr:DUF523 domain-containing protein [Clostridia bacterium]
MKKCVLVSACLLGVPCRYDGASKPDDRVAELKENYELIPFCPEVEGGLSTPRIPCERQGGRVIRRDGANETEAYRRGASLCLSAVREKECAFAVLKEKSPSCGVNFIYDGSFTGKLIRGCGVTAELLRKNGINVYSEEDTDKIEKKQNGC